MKIGVRAHDFGRRDEADLARTVREAGFEAVQLALTKAVTGIAGFRDPSPARLESVRKAFDDQQVEVSVLGCYIEPALPDRDERLRHVDNFLVGIEHAKALGAKLIGTETTNFDPSPASVHLREEAYLRLRDSVERMAEAAERHGVDIGIEPVAEHTLNTSALARRLLDEVGSSRLKIIMDPVNMLLPETAANQEAIYAAFFKDLGKDIRAIHLKDVVIENGEKVWRNIGKGMVRHEPVFAWLKANLPDAPVLREHVKPESAAVDVAAMRRLMGRG